MHRTLVAALVGLAIVAGLVALATGGFFADTSGTGPPHALNQKP